MRLNLIAPINRLGYGVVGTNLLTGLHARCEDVGLVPIGQMEFDESLSPIVSSCVQVGKTIHSANDTVNIRLWHQFDMRMFPPGVRIGFPIFELNKFSDLEKNNLCSLDALFVCSTWAKNILLQNAIYPPATVIPLGYNPKIFNTNNLYKPDPSKFVFMNVGKWEIRKGHGILPQIIRDAFGPDYKTPDGRDIVLRMMCTNPFLSADENAAWENTYRRILGKHVEFVPRVGSAADVANIMHTADAGIFPAFAEGWNLELLEMQACGKPCLATNYSAHTDFCDSYSLVDFESLNTAYDGRWFFGNGQWANFDTTDIWVDKLRDLVDNYRDYLPLKPMRFTWDNTIDHILNSGALH